MAPPTPLGGLHLTPSRETVGAFSLGEKGVDAQRRRHKEDRMNIFVVDSDPVIAAQSLADVHCTCTCEQETVHLHALACRGCGVSNENMFGMR